MTTTELIFFILVFLSGEFVAYFIFKSLVYVLNREWSLKIDRAVIKGILERLFLFLALVYGLPQALIAFGALKIGARFIQDENKISNDYFYMGNIISLLIALIYYAVWVQFEV